MKPPAQPYDAVDTRVDFPQMEETILQFWKEKDIFRRSLAQRAGHAEFIFYDGPPFATGLPHFGHFVPGTIKDIIPRYQTMRGRYVERRFGWDCHGLPVEYEMEKELNISGRAAIEAFGIAQFNEACRSIVLRYTAEWQAIVDRMGRWVDFEHDYKTMDPDYMESIWWIFSQLWQQGLIYQGYYILPYSPGMNTPLSNFEVNLGGYRDVHDPAITVRFGIQPNTVSQRLGLPNNTAMLAWTTTPWTLPSNLGLAVGPKIEYVLLQDGDEHLIVAGDRLHAYYHGTEEYRIVARIPGADLAGVAYRPLFPYFAHLDTKGAFVIHAADFVSTDEGTGIVHLAPGFGEDDYQILKQSGLPIIVPIDDDCRFTHEVPDFEGLFVKDADTNIIGYLKEHGALVKRENWLHSYPFCYRTDTPLIYRAISSWFVNIERIKSTMLAANQQIDWIPEHMKNGRFGKWLENARDWAISRNRYWGNPIPIWKCDGSDYMECIGSRDELERKCGQAVPDLHKHFVDSLVWPSPDGKGVMRRIPEVLDCWFESGAMPYAQQHYPFENRRHFENNFPADFICEGLDQTRGWFYTLTVLAAALFKRPAFHNVIVNGLVLASDGKKMSKSARNYTDPKKIIDAFGADALRLFLINSSVVHAEDLKYSDEGVKEVLKGVIIPLWNAYSFFVTYANIDDIRPQGAPNKPANSLDRWILSEIERMTTEIQTHLDAYELQKAIEPLTGFIDMLNNWYIRRSRRRFWRSENDGDKQDAYGTLHAALLRLITVAAPFIPFVTDAIYRNLRHKDSPESVHLCNWPTVDVLRRDKPLERKMRLCRRAVSMGHAIRRLHNIKIRQPLQTLYLVTTDDAERAILREMRKIIREEVNVKEVLLRDNEEDLVEYRAKPNYPLLGRIMGSRMKSAAATIEALTSSQIQEMLADSSPLRIEIEGRQFELTKEQIVLHRIERPGLRVQSDGSLVVALDAHISEQLAQEGIARDIVRHVQNLRKQSGHAVTDRIDLTIAGPKKITTALEAFRDYIQGEILADTTNSEIVPPPLDVTTLSKRFGAPDNWATVTIGNEECWLALHTVRNVTR